MFLPAYFVQHLLAARLAALEDFYDSDLWWSHRDAVNATLVDSDNVLLLNAVVEPHAVGEPGIYTAVIWPYADLAEDLSTREETVALLVTEHSENDFPRLPVREGENVVVWLAAGDVEPPQVGSGADPDAASGSDRPLAARIGTAQGADSAARLRRT